MSLLPTIVVLALCAIVCIASSQDLKRAYNRLNGEIRNHDDLLVVRKAINLNMLQAMIVLTIGGFWLIGFVIATYFGLLRGWAIPVHSGILTVGSIILHVYTSQSVDRFMELKTNPLKPEIGETYNRWKKEWQGPRIRLSDR
jgi:hypothetical protein